jgi:homoserine kinase type II
MARAGAGRFLIELKRKTQNLPCGDAHGVFSLKDYIYKLIRAVNFYNKDISVWVNNVVFFLGKDFMSVYDKMPVFFSHGDYHPLNVIWSDEGIKCVIDWEFSGYKSELYDAANLIGCVGVEDQRSLTADLVVSFIAEMKKSGIISKESWKYLTKFITALRFAWLAEWLRRNDTEMISLEIDYLRLLIDNRTALEKSWP